MTCNSLGKIRKKGLQLAFINKSSHSMYLFSGKSVFMNYSGHGKAVFTAR